MTSPFRQERYETTYITMTEYTKTTIIETRPTRYSGYY